MPGAGKGIRGASLAHALLFPSYSLPFPPGLSAKQGGRASSIRRERRERREEPALCAPREHKTHPLWGWVWVL